MGSEWQLLRRPGGPLSALGAVWEGATEHVRQLWDSEAARRLVSAMAECSGGMAVPKVKKAAARGTPLPPHSARKNSVSLLID